MIVVARRVADEQRIERMLLVHRRPWMAVMMSPSWTPADAAGLSAMIDAPWPFVVDPRAVVDRQVVRCLTCRSTDVNRMPIHGRASSSPRERLFQDRPRDVDGDREADAVRVAWRSAVLMPTIVRRGVDERPARVARVDRRVGLDAGS